MSQDALSLAGDYAGRTCTNCGRGVHAVVAAACLSWTAGDEVFGYTVVSGHYRCPLCKEVMVALLRFTHAEEQIYLNQDISVYPADSGVGKRTLDASIPASLLTDFRESEAVLPHSAKASAALSRALLQRILHEQGYQAKNLDSEIEMAVTAGLPSLLAGQLHAIRVVGNFAAHPIKDTTTNAIIDVEPGEADFLLAVLESLLDYYYVLPQRSRLAIDAINNKLLSAGKKPLPYTPPASPPTSNPDAPSSPSKPK